MKSFFEPAPTYTTYSISSQRKQAHLDIQKTSNTFSYVSPSDIASPPIKGTIKIIDTAAYDYPVEL